MPYLLIGGFAVIAHGASRFTKDIDLLVDDDAANVAKVKAGHGVLANNAASVYIADCSSARTSSAAIGRGFG